MTSAGDAPGRRLLSHEDLARTWKQIEPLLAHALEMDAGTRRLARRPHATTREAPLLRDARAHERAERSGELETVPRLASLRRLVERPRRRASGSAPSSSCDSWAAAAWARCGSRGRSTAASSARWRSSCPRCSQHGEVCARALPARARHPRQARASAHRAPLRRGRRPSRASRGSRWNTSRACRCSSTWPRGRFRSPGAWRSSGRCSPPSPTRTATSSCTAT